ncbi:hypothetical protein [Novosphingobium sp. EMRT-2]|nr:hypothetical protein [Novosphingobium sp. EMRT-2]
MNIATLVILDVIALAVLFWLAARAPLGWQDEDGFHVRERPE